MRVDPETPSPGRHLQPDKADVPAEQSFTHALTIQGVTSGQHATALHVMHQERTGPRGQATLADRHHRWLPGTHQGPKSRSKGGRPIEFLIPASGNNYLNSATALSLPEVTGCKGWWNGHQDHQIGRPIQGCRGFSGACEPVVPLPDAAAQLWTQSQGDLDKALWFMDEEGKYDAQDNHALLQ